MCHLVLLATSALAVSGCVGLQLPALEVELGYTVEAAEDGVLSKASRPRSSGRADVLSVTTPERTLSAEAFSEVGAAYRFGPSAEAAADATVRACGTGQ